ncbi:hypothetical protein HPB48_023125 [Haemaphysalis longicornis]|uniref:Uncharacterized protein n=1 Tax=Haemaphysalis longicornis TaxID=44386 RepID=A0A9J6FBN3_HAELO|nr:hypothetical protein HPB48_023125 [Haemaphysalis longicornis]
MLQKTHCIETPKLPGYRAHAKAAKTLNENKTVAHRPVGRVCMFIREGIVFVEYELNTGNWTDSCVVEVIIGRRTKASTLACKRVQQPDAQEKKFRTLMQKALSTINTGTAVIGREFNAPHYH